MAFQALPQLPKNQKAKRAVISADTKSQPLNGNLNGNGTGNGYGIV